LDLLFSSRFLPIKEVLPFATCPLIHFRAPSALFDVAHNAPFRRFPRPAVLLESPRSPSFFGPLVGGIVFREGASCVKTPGDML